MVNAVYLHSMTVLLVEDIYKCEGNLPAEPMIPVSIYFLLFAIISTGYLIRNRSMFRKD